MNNRHINIINLLRAKSNSLSVHHPEKLYMVIFREADGKLYARGSMTIWIHEKTDSNSSKLSSNSSAEILIFFGTENGRKKWRDKSDAQYVHYEYYQTTQ